jgi:3-polyprenyl-4-hydroxybenzoate decarboxylase
MNKQELKSALKDIRQANLAVRNFPLSVAELRKKLKLADGGSTYIFATTKADGQHFLLICDKVSQK